MVQEGEKAAMLENQKISSFYQNADLLIHDAQYTQTEYENAKKGWGHSPFEFAIQSARDAKVKTIALFHHDPDRSDKELENLEIHYRRSFGHSSNFNILVAKEGAFISI
jgi:ribonuclease BN (tRNA processing enzyme)